MSVIHVRFSSTHHEPPHCDACERNARGPIPNKVDGGFFWRCKCGRTWDLDGRPNPFHGPIDQGIILRDVLRYLLTKEGIDAETALDQYGVEALCDLLDIDIKNLKVLRDRLKKT